MRSKKEICDLDNLNQHFFEIGYIDAETYNRVRDMIPKEYTESTQEEQLLKTLMKKHKKVEN